MSDTSPPNTSTLPASAPVRLVPLVAALMVLPGIAYVVGLINLPQPKNVEASRTTVDRKELAGQVLLTQTPTPRVATTGSFGNKITVLGMDMDTAPVTLGNRVPITFYFRCESEMQESWKVFLHVDSQNGQYRMHGDHFPPEGYGTERWRKGDIIADRYTLWVPLDAQKGNYDIWLGFYDPAHEDDRLQLPKEPGVPTDGSNRLKLGQLTVF